MSDLWSVADIELKPGSGDKKMDYEAYARLQAAIDKDLEKVGKEEALARRRENTRRWLTKVPSRWREVSLNSTPHHKDLRSLLQKFKLHSFFISEKPTEGLASGYALLKVFVSQGWVFPEQVAVTSEEELLAAASGGFEGAAFLTSFLRHKVFMITLAGKEYYSEREKAAWSRIIAHCFDEGLVLVLISGDPFEKFLRALPRYSSEKVKELVHENIVNNEVLQDEFDVFED